MHRFPNSAGRANLLVAFVLSSVAGRAEEGKPRLAVPVTGPAFEAQVLSIDQQWNVSLQAAGEQRLLAANQLVNWGAYRDREQGPQIVLADGGLLVAEVLKINPEFVLINGDLCGQVELPLQSVRGILLEPPATPIGRDRALRQLAEVQPGSDHVFLDNGDELKGTVIGPPAAAPALAEQQDHVWIQSGQQRLPIPLDRIAALVFNPALVNPVKIQGLHALVGFRDGSLLDVSRFDARDDQLQLRLAGGVVLDVDPATVWQDLASLRPWHAEVTYLSDLEPIGYKHIPFLEISWPFSADRNVLGGRLRKDGKIFPKGLGMHSTSRLAYELAGQFARFEAELAIDERAGFAGSVVFRVFVERQAGDDGAESWSVAYQSPVVRGADGPLPVSVDVSGALRLALIVDAADRGDQLDYANWLDARLLK